MLLYGPPGCGKTQIARYIAAELELPLIVARMDSLISSYLGSTAKNLRLLFEFAASHPCILFLDEFDALAKMRDDTRELGELKRVVISLLQNIDALGRDHLLVAATNHDHLLDPAVWRRFAHRIHVDAPDVDARKLLLARFYRGFVDDETIDGVADRTEGLSGAQLKDVAETAVRDAIINDRSSVSRHDALDAAIRATIIEGEPDSLKKRINFLYSADKKTYTQSRLAEIFKISQSQVSRILKEFRNGETEKQ
ncbi:MAG: ATP-binding protein [Pirellulales bacterium]